MSASLREGGRGREAHSGSNGGVGELGGASATANLRRRSSVAEEGNGGASGIQGLPAPFVWMRMKRATRRSFLGRRRGGAVAVAAANGVGGDELRSGREGERAEERMRRGRE